MTFSEIIAFCLFNMQTWKLQKSSTNYKYKFKKITDVQVIRIIL